ncbi:MAG TPA: hypothetical protein DCP28_28270, partial [Cytophagales bacterium]|nr:hypothetical protein [Cytophagales bacterium]
LGPTVQEKPALFLRAGLPSWIQKDIRADGTYCGISPSFLNIIIMVLETVAACPITIGWT